MCFPDRTERPSTASAFHGKNRAVLQNNSVPYGSTKWTSGTEKPFDPYELETGDLILFSNERDLPENLVSRRTAHVVMFNGFDADGRMWVSEASSYRNRVLTQEIRFNDEGKRADTGQYVCAVVSPNYNYGLDGN